MSAQPTTTEKLERCRQRATELARLNPGLVFVYDSGGVFHRWQGRDFLFASWTINGWFIADATFESGKRAHAFPADPARLPASAELPVPV